MLKADLHVHSQYSMDCDMSLETIIERAQALGINCIALADHGTVEGALKMQRMAPFPVIVAEEILTDKGEIMGMFLKETIPSGGSLEDAISSIKTQGGLVCAQHPFDTVLRFGLGEKVMEDIADRIDLVEVLNARSPLPLSSERALRFARKYNLPTSAGSDAHTPGEIGNAYIEIPEFQDSRSFLEALAKGEVGGHLTGPIIYFNSLVRMLRKGL
ncbi:MAG: PHP domain-containing protein [Chloroflexota bacterium]